MAKRIQRRREKGWRMPEGCVYVGRPTIYGNPFIVPDEAAIAVEAYRLWLTGDAYGLFKMCLECGVPLFPLVPEKWNDLLNVQMAIRCRLEGKDLACWCPLDAPCHADVLLELANNPTGATECQK